MAPSSPPVPQPTPTLQPSARWASFSDIPVRQYSAPVEHVAPAMPPAHPDVPPPAPVPAESAHAAPPPPAPVEAAVQHFVVNKWGVPVVDNVPHIYSNMPAHDAVNNFGDVPTHEIGNKHERLFAYGNGTTQQEHEAFADFIGRYFQQNPHVKEIIAPDNTHTHSVVWSRAANGQVQATLFPTTPKHFFGMLGGKSLPLPTPGEFKRMVL